MINKLIACNWKMCKNHNEIDNFFDVLQASNIKNFNNYFNNLLIAPSFLHIKYCIDKQIEGLQIASQNVSAFENGAFTGDVSALMLADAGVKYCLVGHSERRQIFGETNDTVKQKLMQCHQNGIKTILCIGETLEQLDEGRFEEVILNQIQVLKNLAGENVILAYEPVWAIGTGKTPSIEEIKQKYLFIKQHFAGQVLYGGSVNEKNFAEIIKINEVDGVLVGGASLKPENVIYFLQTAGV